VPDLPPALIDYLLYVAASTGYHLLVLLGPATVLGYLIHRTAAAISVAIIRRLQVGLLGYMWMIGWPGTVVHELGHFLMALIFGFKVLDKKWVDFNPKGGSLGHVRISPPKNLYQQIGLFFIGIAPILFGTLIIYLSSRLLLGPEIFTPMREITISSEVLESGAKMETYLFQLAKHIGAVFDALFTEANTSSWRFWAFMYIALSVGSSMHLSRADLRSASYGLLAMAALILTVNLIVAAIGVWPDVWFETIVGWYSGFYALMAFVLLINLLFAAVLALLALFV